MNTPSAAKVGDPVLSTGDVERIDGASRRPLMRAVAAILLGSSLLLAGCSGSNGGSDDPTSPAPSQESSTPAESSSATDSAADSELKQLAVGEVTSTLQYQVDTGEAEYATSEGNVSDESVRTTLREELDDATSVLASSPAYDDLQPACEANQTLPAAIDAVSAARTDTATQ